MLPVLGKKIQVIGIAPLARKYVMLQENLQNVQIVDLGQRCFPAKPETIQTWTKLKSRLPFLIGRQFSSPGGGVIIDYVEVRSIQHFEKGLLGRPQLPELKIRALLIDI